MVEQHRLISFANDSSPDRINAVAQMNADMFADSDQELIGGTRAMRDRRNARLGNNQRRLQRTDDQPEEIDGDESMDDEEFKTENSNEFSGNHDYGDSEEDEFDSL